MRRMRRWAGVLAVSVWLAAGPAATSAQQDAENLHAVIESVNASARRVIASGYEYAIAGNAVIQWQSGQRASIDALAPGTRVTIELVSGTANDPVPRIRVIILQLS